MPPVPPAPSNIELTSTPTRTMATIPDTRTQTGMWMVNLRSAMCVSNSSYCQWPCSSPWRDDDLEFHYGFAMARDRAVADIGAASAKCPAREAADYRLARPGRQMEADLVHGQVVLGIDRSQRDVDGRLLTRHLDAIRTERQFIGGDRKGRRAFDRQRIGLVVGASGRACAKTGTTRRDITCAKRVHHLAKSRHHFQPPDKLVSAMGFSYYRPSATKVWTLGSDRTARCGPYRRPPSVRPALGTAKRRPNAAVGYKEHVTRVLVVEDERLLADAIAEGLRRQAMAVDVVYDGDAALQRLAVTDYDVVVLDRDLPVVSGDEVCRTLVDAGVDTRILMLTAATAVLERVAGLRLGADDYLTKPFALPELTARVEALGRRARPAPPPVLQRAGIRLDPYRHTVTRDGQLVGLSRKEFAVLAELLRAEGGVVSAEQLLEKAWDEHTDPFTGVVRFTIMMVRRKLGDPPVIETIPSSGYLIP